MTILLILFCSVLSFAPNNLSEVQAATGVFVENFSTTTYLDAANTDAIGWGTGLARSPDKPDPELKGIYNTTSDPVDVFVKGDYAYVAEYHGGLSILDISDPTNPTSVSNYTIGGGAGTPTGVYVDGSVCYVTTRHWGLQIVDVSNPASPSNLTAYYTIDHPRDVYVKGIYCYVADEDGGVQIINVNNPASPTNVTAIDTGGYVYGVYVEGDYLCIADYFSKFFVYNVANPYIPIYQGNISLSSNAYDLSVDGNIAYVADGWAGLLTIDIADPTDPTILDTYNSGDYVKDAKFEEKKVYITDQTSGVVVIDATDPSDLTLIGSYDTWNWPEGLFVKDRMVYVSDYMGGFLVLDHTGYVTPVYVQSTNVVSITDDVFITKATLLLNNFSTLWGGMAIGMYVSSNGGGNWTYVTNGVETRIDNPGKDLRFQLLLVCLNLVNATWVSELTLSYTSEPDSPNILTPTDGTHTSDNTTTLTWDPVIGADSYILQINDASNFIAQIVNASLLGSATDYQTPELPDDTYYWRILAIDSAGDPGNWSSIWSFTIDTTNPVVVGESDFDFNEGETGHNVTWDIFENNPAYFAIYLNDTPVPGMITPDDSQIWISTDGLESGIHNYTLVLIDKVGNIGKDTVFVTVNVVISEFNSTLAVLPIIFSIGICILFATKRRN